MSSERHLDLTADETQHAREALFACAETRAQDISHAGLELLARSGDPARGGRAMDAVELSDRIDPEPIAHREPKERAVAPLEPRDPFRQRFGDDGQVEASRVLDLGIGA